MRALSFSVVLLAFSLTSITAATDDTNSFVDHFYDDANIPGYVSSVDRLIDSGEARIYKSIDEEKKDAQSPRAKTSNGILMLYTVTHLPDGVLVHFSTSRSPYLPMVLGKHIVGLFMARSCWPKPALFQVSEHQVFHAIWMIPESQFAEFQKELPELRAKIRSSESVKLAFTRGLLRSAELEEQHNQAQATSSRKQLQEKP